MSQDARCAKIDDTDKISLEDQQLFQSRIRLPLNLMKHSRPDIANAVQELLKIMDGKN